MCVSLYDIGTDTPSTDQLLDTIQQNCNAFNFIICTVIIGTFCFLGLAGNITSFLVLTQHKTETSTIFLLQCLALSDSLLLGVSVIVYTLPEIYPYTQKLQTLYDACDRIKVYVWPVSMIAHTATIWLTVLVTFTRYRSVCIAIKRTVRDPLCVVKMQAAVVAVAAVLYNIPRFFEHTEIYTIHGGTNATNATFNLGDSKIYQIIYSNILYFPVMYVIPLLSLAFMNIRLIKTIGAIRVRRESMTGHKCRRDHITLCIIIIVCVFIVCQTPALVNQIFWAVTTNMDRQCGKFHFYYTKISDVLVVVNSSTNFMVYCLFGRSFRKIFLDALCVKRICHRNKGSSSGSKPYITDPPLDDICALCKSLQDECIGLKVGTGGEANNKKYIEMSSTKCSCKNTTGINTKVSQLDQHVVTEPAANATSEQRNTLLIPRR